MQIEPFRIAVPDEQLDDLRARLRATRWPEAETVDDWSQGIPLAYVQEVCRYWADDYDWRAREAALNRFDQLPDHDRRPRHPRHPRALAPRGRAPTGHHARLAGLGRGVPQGDRAADRPRPRTAGGPRTPSTWSARRCPATASPASRPPPAGASTRSPTAVRRADGRPGLRPLRRPGRRLGLGGHHRARQQPTPSTASASTST